MDKHEKFKELYKTLERLSDDEHYLVILKPEDLGDTNKEVMYNLTKSNHGKVIFIAGKDQTRFE